MVVGLFSYIPYFFRTYSKKCSISYFALLGILSVRKTLGIVSFDVSFSSLFLKCIFWFSILTKVISKFCDCQASDNIPDFLCQKDSKLYATLSSDAPNIFSISKKLNENSFLVEFLKKISQIINIVFSMFCYIFISTAYFFYNFENIRFIGVFYVCLYKHSFTHITRFMNIR